MMIRDRTRRSAAALAFGIVLAMLATAPVLAFHFPWDQRHDTTDWEDPTDPGPCEGPNCDPCSSTRSPVYIPTGHFLWSEQDIDMPGRPGLDLVRAYNSHDPRSGAFGNGWSTGCEVGLFLSADSELDADGNAVNTESYILRTQDGKRYVYESDGAGGFSAPANRYDSIERNTDGSASLVARDGGVRNFGGTGKLLGESSPSGQLLDYRYDLNGLLTRITDQAGRFIALEYDTSGRVVVVRDNTDRTWTYAYDTNGNLTSVTDPAGGVRRYSYQSYRPSGDGHTYYQLTEVRDESDVVLTAVTYSGERVTSYTVAENRFTYAYNTTSRQVTKTDRVGSQWTFLYDENGLTLNETDPIGGVEAFQYDENGNVTRYVDPLAKPWNSSYDERGRRTSATNPLGERIEWQYESEFPYPTRTVSPTGRVTLATYDGSGNILDITDPSGAVTRYTWSATGNLESIRNAVGEVTETTTDAAGLPIALTDPTGRVTQMSYDGVGNVETITNADGDVIRFEYDLLSRLTRVLEPTNKETTYTRDAAGRVTSVTDPAGQATLFEYDGFGRVSARVGPGGDRLEYNYRSDNLISQITHPDDTVESYTYDAAKRVVTASAAGDTVTYTYNARHELVSASNEVGTVSLAYDDVGRVASETVNGATNAYEYNAEGERTRRETLGDAVQLVRDDRGYISGIVASEGAYTFDLDGLTRRTRLVMPNGQSAEYAYDAGNRLAQLTQTGPFNETFDYTYDTNGMLATVSSGGDTWTYDFDADGLLVSAANDSSTFSYAYDLAGNLLGDGRTYDGANRLVSDAGRSYTYDERGNLRRKEDSTTGARTEYSWDGWGRLARVERFADSVTSTPYEVVEYAYGPLGRRWNKTSNGVVERFVYDGFDRIATLDSFGTPLETVTFGSRVDEPLAVKSEFGESFLHADHLGSIIAITDGAVVSDEYSYSPFGGLTSGTPRTGTPFLYTAREYEAPDLYNYRSRYYDPEMRRFIGEDPRGFAGGDLNLYAYAGNNPVHIKDPRGEAIWFAIPIIWGAVEVGLSLYDAYDTTNTIADPCKSAGEKWLAGGLFVAGALLPGGGYSAADDIVTSKPVKEGIYEFVDTSGKKYVGQSNDAPRRLGEHIDAGKLDGGQHVDVTSLPGSSKTQREIAEHRRVQEITGGVPARQSDAVSNMRDPIGPKRQHLLND